MAKFELTISAENFQDLFSFLAPAASATGGVKLETKVADAPAPAAEVAAAAKKTKKVATPPVTVDTTKAGDELGDLLGDAKEITLQQLSDKMVELGKKSGKPAMVKILEAMGSKTISGLKPEQYAKAFALTEAALAQ